MLAGHCKMLIVVICYWMVLLRYNCLKVVRCEVLLVAGNW